jgi:hypothetical protein
MGGLVFFIEDFSEERRKERARSRARVMEMLRRLSRSHSLTRSPLPRYPIFLNIYFAKNWIHH